MAREPEMGNRCAAGRLVSALAFASPSPENRTGILRFSVEFVFRCSAIYQDFRSRLFEKIIGLLGSRT
jgi:hypothetical protein